MKRVSILLCVGMGYYTHVHGLRQRIVFVNQSVESVLVYIGYENRPPVHRSVVEIGESKYFFPPELVAGRPYYLNLEGMYTKTQYTLHLTGDMQRALVRACRSYGDLQLMRSDYLVDSMGAGGIDKGMVLTYTPEFELKISKFKLVERPHSVKKPCGPYCTPCAPRVKIAQSQVIY